jgi:cytochrome c556
LPLGRCTQAIRGAIQRRGDFMMKRIVLAVAVVALGVTAVVAQSDPIAARKALMKENGKQSGIARAMIEGKEPFDLAKAKTVLANFAAASEKGKNLWPDNSKAGDTASLPAIWENKADFDAKLAKLSADAKAKDAGVKDLDSFKAAMGDIGKDCGGCHNTYRKKPTT